MSNKLWYIYVILNQVTREVTNERCIKLDQITWKQHSLGPPTQAMLSLYHFTCIIASITIARCEKDGSCQALATITKLVEYLYSRDDIGCRTTLPMGWFLKTEIGSFPNSFSIQLPEKVINFQTANTYQQTRQIIRQWQSKTESSSNFSISINRAIHNGNTRVYIPLYKV